MKSALPNLFLVVLVANKSNIRDLNTGKNQQYMVLVHELSLLRTCTVFVWLSNFVLCCCVTAHKTKKFMQFVPFLSQELANLRNQVNHLRSENGQLKAELENRPVPHTALNRQIQDLNQKVMFSE